MPLVHPKKLCFSGTPGKNGASAAHCVQRVSSALRTGPCRRIFAFQKKLFKFGDCNTQTPPQPIKKHNTGVYPYCDNDFVHGQLWKDFSNKLEKPADVLTQTPVKTTPSAEGFFQQVGKTG